jgi:hypothetical protein
MLHDPFNRVRLPGDFSREGRVRLLGEAFDALVRGEMPSPEACMFLAAGGIAWLEQGGDLLGDYWKVKAPAGSHHTASALWQRSSRGATDVKRPDSIESSSHHACVERAPDHDRDPRN